MSKCSQPVVLEAESWHTMRPVWLLYVQGAVHEVLFLGLFTGTEEACVVKASSHLGSITNTAYPFTNAWKLLILICMLFALFWMALLALTMTCCRAACSSLMVWHCWQWPHSIRWSGQLCNKNSIRTQKTILVSYMAQAFSKAHEESMNQLMQASIYLLGADALLPRNLPIHHYQLRWVHCGSATWYLQSSLPISWEMIATSFPSYTQREAGCKPVCANAWVSSSNDMTN